jgi:hypothetical protein
MRTMSSRCKSPQTTTADGGAISSAPEAKETNETPRYETYEVQRVREIEQQRAILRNELLLLHHSVISSWTRDKPLFRVHLGSSPTRNTTAETRDPLKPRSSSQKILGK